MSRPKANNSAATLLVLVLLLFASSCHKTMPVNRAFYYWRSTFTLSSSEKNVIDSCKIRKLYIKYFELVEGDGGLHPRGIITWIDSLPGNEEVVPVVFIPNKVLMGISAAEMPGYAQKMCRQISLVHPGYAKPYHEIQVDCDWTDKTRNAFFALISGMKNICDAQSVLLTVTLRLHQIKYKSITGVPPVSRVALMFYNMGKFDTSALHTSILDLQQSEKYVQYIKNYPLPMDVALPVFGWGVQMRAGKAVDLLHNFGMAEAALLPYLKNSGNGVFVCDSNLFYHGLYLEKGDLVKTEMPDYENLMLAEKKLLDVLPNQQRSLVLFDLEPGLTQRYNAQKIQSIYTGFN